MTARGVSVEDQGVSLCYDCHDRRAFPNGTITDRERHYWHTPLGTHGNPDCTNCHMPATATSAVGTDIHSHSFHMLPPDMTIDNQIPNSCMIMCHTGSRHTSWLPGTGGPVNTTLLEWDEPVDVTISEWLLQVLPGSATVTNYLIGSPEYVALGERDPDWVAAQDSNADTEATTGTDASPFVINAADIVTFVDESR
jgi:hypothetical protein